MIKVKRRYRIGGMHCEGCALVIEQAVDRLPGVRHARVDYDREMLEIVCTRNTANRDIERAVQAQGYRCSSTQTYASRLQTLARVSLAALALIGLAALVVGGETLAQHLHMPELGHDMSYGMLFLVGLFTGVHCIGMCGAFIVGYTTQGALAGRHAQWPSHLLYGLGKTLSYALMGGLFGLLGALVTFTPQIRGIAAVIAGVFLVLFGLNMLDWFRSLHAIHIHMPRWLTRFLQSEVRHRHSPFVIGLLNGLMIACGPLQAMYVMAAGTGQFLEGAKLLLAFGLGTLPALFGFAAFASLVSAKVTQGLLKASAVLVMALGLIMLNRGLILGGSGYDLRSLASLASTRWSRQLSDPAQAPELAPAYQVIHMAVTHKGYEPNRFVLEQGVPVRWVIEGRELTACNRGIVVPALDLEIELHEGVQTIEFTPTQAGVIPWSCWMGMIPGSFIVEAAGSAAPP